MNALHYALIRNDLKTACSLLEHGADPNELPEQEEEGVTPMHLAAGQGLEATRLLLEFGGDPNVRSSDLSTPLHIAATWGELDVVQLLIYNGGDPRLRDQDDCRPVDVAESSDHPECVEFLLHQTRLLAQEDETLSPKYTCRSLTYNTASTTETLTSLSGESTATYSGEGSLQSSLPCLPRQTQGCSNSSSLAQKSCQITPEKMLLQKFILARSPHSPTCTAGAAGATDLETKCSSPCRRDECSDPLRHCHLRRNRQVYLSDCDAESTDACLSDHLATKCSVGGGRLYEENAFYVSSSNKPSPHLRKCQTFPQGRDTVHHDGSCPAQCGVEGFGIGKQVTFERPFCHRHRGEYVPAKDHTVSPHVDCGSCWSECGSHCIHGNSGMLSSVAPYGRCWNDASRERGGHVQHFHTPRSGLRDQGCGDNGSSLSVNRASVPSPSVSPAPTHDLHSCKETQTNFLQSGGASSERDRMQGGDPAYYAKYFPPVAPKTSLRNSGKLSPHFENFLKSCAASQGGGDGRVATMSVYDDGAAFAQTKPPVLNERSTPGSCDRNAGMPQNEVGVSEREHQDVVSLPDARYPSVDKETKDMSNRVLHEMTYSGDSQSSGHLSCAIDREAHGVVLGSKQSGHRSNRRSSMYTSSLNWQINQRVLAREPVRLNVTSPDHPCLEFKSPDGSAVVQQPGRDGARVWHPPGRRSSIESHVSDSSCDTYVTCEDDPEYQREVVRVEDDTDGQTGKKTLANPEFVAEEPSSDATCIAEDLSGTVVELDDDTLKKDFGTPSSTSLPETVSAAGAKAMDVQLPQETSSSGHHHFLGSSKSTQHSWQPPTMPVVDDSDLITSDESFLERSHLKSRRRDATLVSDVGSLAASLQNIFLHPSKLPRIDSSKTSSSVPGGAARERAGDFGSEVVPENGGSGVQSASDSAPSSPDSQHRGLSPSSDRSSPGSQRSSVESIYSQSQVKEYLYTDPDLGISLIERRVGSECGGSARSSLESLSSCLTGDSQSTLLYDWHQYSQHQHPASLQTLTEEEEEEKEGTLVSESLRKLSNAEIRKSLVALGDDPGPVVPSTRQAYLVRLASAKRNPTTLNITTSKPGYCWELQKALMGQLALDAMEDLEVKMVAPFQSASSGRCWREGTTKSSFNYLLLDPRVSRNLPLRAKHMGTLEAFQTFIAAIFYVGKGKRARPYAHLYEAISQTQKPNKKSSDKVRHILEIWKDNLGVVSLHCFQSVIPVEAYTREACMVDAIGVSQLTNQKRGDYYGPASTWSATCRRTMGVYLLQKALQIFLAEGERQICPPDLRTGH